MAMHGVWDVCITLHPGINYNVLSAKEEVASRQEISPKQEMRGKDAEYFGFQLFT
jgi:hypothetical protein